MSASVRRIEPAAVDWQHSSWQGARFDTARRELTDVVEGTICMPQHLLLATVTGGARLLTVRASCGHRYRGLDRAGAISIVPAGHERHLRLHDVEARWASLAFDVDGDVDDERASLANIEGCISNVRDEFLFAALAELTRVRLCDSAIEPMYGEAMTLAIRHYIAQRRGHSPSPAHEYRFTRWQLSRVEAYIEAHLNAPLPISALARLLQCSPTHLHRAFRSTLHATPLQYINHRRIQRAQAILRSDPTLSVTQLAAAVGYTSVNYFTRLFKRVVGMTPARYRGQRR